MKTGVKILILIVICFSVSAQKTLAQLDGKNNKTATQKGNSSKLSASAEIKKIKQLYEKEHNLSMDVTYKVFINHTAGNAVESNVGHFKKQGEDFESNIEGLITLQNKVVLLTADPETQKMYVTRPAKVKSSFAALPLDTLLEMYANSKVTELDSKNNKVTLAFLSNGVNEEDDIKPEYEKIEIYYSPTSYIINKLVMYYGNAVSIDEEKFAKEKPRMEVIFSNLNFKPAFDKSSFSEKRFFQEKNGKLIATNDFKAFQIFDQRLKK